MALADRAELAVRLTLDDRQFKGALRNTQSALGKLDKNFSNAQRALGRTGANLQRVALIAAGAATGGFLAVINAAGDFQQAFTGIEKTVDGTGPQLAELRDQIRAMAREMPVAATELARIGEIGGALGLNVQDLDEFISTVAKLSVTTDLTADDAADALGRIKTILGLSAGDLDNFASALVALGNDGASTEAQIIEITKRFAASGAQAGLTTDQILAYSSAISSLGVEPEAAGTALSKAFSRIIQETAAATAEGKAFAEVAGLSFKDFSKIVYEDTNGALLLVLEGLSKLDKFEASRALEDLGITAQRERDAILKFAQNTGFLAEQLGIAQGAIKDTTALDKEADKFFGTFNSQVQKAQNILNDVGIVVGEKLLPKITPLLEEFGNWVATHGPEIERFGDQVASAFVGVVDAIRNLPWESIKSGLEVTIGLVKTAIDAFKALPGPLQGLLVGGFAINKLTGGLVTGLAKDLAGLVGGLAAGAGGKAGALGRLTAQPVYVVNFPPGFGAGPGVGPTTTTGGKLLNLIGKVFIVGMAAEVATLLSGPVVELGQTIHEALGLNKTPLGDFGQSFEQWRANAPWPFGQKPPPRGMFEDFFYQLFGGTLPPTPTAPTKPLTGGMSPDERQEFNNVVAATNAVSTKLEATRLAISSAAIAEKSTAALTTAQTTAKLEANRLAIANMTNRTAMGLQNVKGSIDRKQLSVKIQNNINAFVTVRDQQVRARSASAFGFMIGGK